MKLNNELIITFFLPIITGIAIILFCCILIGDEKESKPKGVNITSDYWYNIVKIDGHDYIIAGIVGYRGSGLTHSESCPCKKE